MLIAITSYHVTNIQKNNCHPCFFTTLLFKEKESTKHLLVTSLIVGKYLRTHTIINSRRGRKFVQRNCWLYGSWIKTVYRSSHQWCFVRKGVLRNSQNSKVNTYARILFLIKLQASAYSFI